MRLFFPLCLVMLLGLSACITDGGQVQNLQARLDRESAKVQDLSRRLEVLSQSVDSNRQPQANLVNEINSLRQEVARLNGRVEESAAGSRGRSAVTAPAAENSGQLQNLDTRLTYVERYLGIPTTPAAVPSTGGTAVSAAPPDNPPSSPDDSPQTIFDAGMRLFKQSSYQAAQDRFENILQNYSNHKLAEPAQFWLGESLYANGKYEEAILAYNQLIKRYPNSKNLLAAQLKQGMSFAALGDNQAAKILFNKIVSASPNSSEGKAAKEQLNKLPK